MSAFIDSPVALVNAALAHIKAGVRVGSLYEGSAVSKVALDTYGQTRDAMLRAGEWGFARRDVVMDLLKSAPAGGYVGVTWNPVTHPPLPWKYAYAYPADCLKVRAIRGQPNFIPDFDPQPVVFNTPNSVVTIEAVDTELKLICCNVADGILTYTGQVTDPALWEATFAEAMIEEMGKILAANVNPELLKLQDVEEARDEAVADMVQG